MARAFSAGVYPTMVGKFSDLQYSNYLKYIREAFPNPFTSSDH